MTTIQKLIDMRSKSAECSERFYLLAKRESDRRRIIYLNDLIALSEALGYEDIAKQDREEVKELEAQL